MPVEEENTTTPKTGKRSTADSGEDIKSKFKALRRFTERERQSFFHRAVRARLMDLATFGAEEQHMRTIRALVKPLLVSEFDYPYPETGTNGRGGRTHALLIQAPRDVWPTNSNEAATVNTTITTVKASAAESADHAPFFVACEANSWDELYAAVEAKSRDGEWWTRAIGQRQAVYDWVYERRFRLTGDDEDALDFAIGAADMPLLDLDYFAQWCAAAPTEVREHPVALRVLKVLAGDDVEGYLAGREAHAQGRLVSE